MPDATSTAMTEWLRRYVTELSSIDPDAPLDDLEPLRDMVGDARVVALGEGAHFIEEFWTVRRRLLRFLHERLGFDIVAAEFDLGEGEELGQWLAHPSDARPLRDVSRGAADWGMSTTAHWLRSWGSTQARGIRFVGLDAPNGGAAFVAMLAWVSRYLREVDPDCVPVLDRVEPIAAMLAGTSAARSAQAWAALGEAKQDALTAGLARLHQRMRALDAVLVERSERGRVDGARRRLEAPAHPAPGQPQPAGTDRMPRAPRRAPALLRSRGGLKRPDRVFAHYGVRASAAPRARPLQTRSVLATLHCASKAAPPCSRPRTRAAVGWPGSSPRRAGTGRGGESSAYPTEEPRRQAGWNRWICGETSKGAGAVFPCSERMP
jgi:hypothetical protein